MRGTDDEHVILEARRHGIVLVRPLARALLLGAIGALVLLAPDPVPLASPVVLVIAAFLALRSVWGWEATRLVVTHERLLVSSGIVRHRQVAVRFARLGSVGVEQSLLGRVFGYGTLHAGDLEVRCIARPREIGRLVERLAA
jgi:uncharacterized membrane protein YdbT with pleckstrin-like domain